MERNRVEGFDLYNQCLTGDVTQAIRSVSFPDGIPHVVAQADPTKMVLNDQGGECMDVSYDVTGTIRADMGNHQPLVMESKPYTLKVRGGVDIDSNGHGAGKGPLVQTDLSATLGTSNDQTLFVPTDEPWVVCGALCATDYKWVQQEQVEQGKILPVKVYGISPYHSNAMMSNNPDSGIYEAETARTLDINGGNPACNQGGMMICELYRKDGHAHNAEEGQGWSAADAADTLNASDISEARQSMLVADSYQDKTGPLMANSHPGGCTGQDAYNDMLVTEHQYTVRRLTPIECARLQGFPDDWCADVPHADAAEYKMWGNGMALPCSLYIMEGIAELLGVDNG